MKTYDQLTEAKQKAAVDAALVDILKMIIEDGVRFNDKLNGDDLQARIDAACARADAMQTPWFAHEYILDTCRDDLMRMAQADAEDTLYSEDGEYCRPIPVSA